MKTLTKFIYLPFAALALACFALSPTLQAVVPAPDGGYPGFNTAEGQSALFSLTTGTFNTGIGAFSLNLDKTTSNNTAVGTNALRWNTGSSNTAVGSQPLRFNTTGIQNTAVGTQALFNNSTGAMNTAVGVNALLKNTTGFDNAAVGQGALGANILGAFNSAFGFQALASNITDDNTAVGWKALASNTTGDDNTATGEEALLLNTTGINNTAVGGLALSTNTIISNNTAVGWKALQFSNPPVFSDPNTAFGSFALQNTTTGADNDAFGFQALRANIDGFGNAAHGAFALVSNTHGSFNAAFGAAALFSNTDGSTNTAVGVEAGANILGSWNIDIGAAVLGLAADSHTTRIGLATGGDKQLLCYIGGIFGVTSAGATAVVINSDGKLGTIISSRRFKDEIKPMDKASEAILALKPVTFRYKQEIDPTRGPQFGLVAEDVEKVNPDLVVRDAEGKVNTVRYEAVNAMLLNEFLKEHQTVKALKSTVEKQEAIIARQQKGMEVLTAQLKEQASQIQKVSDKVELNRPAPKTVLNNR